ncbi:MAG: hypothetical protein N3A58_03645 [Spirochaetes bacterium]|nr:hypothetical protein [Spirochaetota bacterium]
MNLKKIFIFFSIVIFFTYFSCQFQGFSSENQEYNELNKEISKLFEIYEKAVVYNDPTSLNDLENYLNEFDSKYNSNLSSDFRKLKTENLNRFSGNNNNYPLLTDLPFDIDGAIYLSGGSSDPVSTVIAYIAPLSTPGKYYHGGALDLNKFDPSNLQVPCIQTAVAKGAGYETAYDWMSKVNVTVLKLKNNVNQTSLNNAQNAMHYYCKPENTNMQYGFFKSYVNVAQIVTKDDNYYWYCTKVVWRLYNILGIDLDSNSSLIDWTKSGLYNAVKTYYFTVYFYDKAKAQQKLNEYINYAKYNIVLAEEIYLSPLVQKIYEKIRKY